MGEPILIVDDDDSVRHWLCRLMDGIGYTAIGAASAEEALETLSQTPMDLAITDLQLPGMDGLALAKRLLAEDADRPVLMVTGYANLNNVREAMSVGIYEYFVKPFDTSDVVAGVRRALERRRLVLENRAYQRDLEQRVEVRTAELQAANARLEREIAEHQQAERELERQRVQAMQADRLRALGEMAAGIAHELNQPLNGIRTFAEGMMYGMKEGWEISEDELRETFSDIVTQVDRMTEIINHMRAFSRDSSEEDPVSFYTRTVVEDALKLVGAQLRVHGIQVHIDIPTDLPACKGWPHQIEQVLLNLISNARDAMDEWAASIKLGDTASSPGWRPTLSIKVDCDAGKNRLRIAVSDTGGGISEDAQPRVFDPFFTTKEVGKGTGLGLSISQNIAERHGGALRLESQPGEGATFLILLPAEDA